MGRRIIMLVKILTWLLTMVDIDVILVGDTVHIVIKVAGKVVLDKSIDLLPDHAGNLKGGTSAKA
jgi:hypothetical protein